MKVSALIPIALGSTRVKDKNLLLVDGEPLVNYVARAAKSANCFEDIYIYSEHEEFEKLAKINGVKFLKRDPEMGGSTCKFCDFKRCQTHDHYLLGFASSVDSDFMVQLHSTSPLIEPETIKEFTRFLLDKEVVVGLEGHQKESLLDRKAINFDIHNKKPTQSLNPVESVCWAITGWNRKRYIENFNNHQPLTFNDKTSYYNIPTIEALDVDSQEELFIVEACLNHKKRIENVGAQYVNLNSLQDIQRDLWRLIKEDGSPILYAKHNRRVARLDSLKELAGDTSNAFPVVWTDNDQVCFIQQKKGEGCRYHYHPTKDEWWVIFEGEFRYDIEGEESFIAKEGDIVYIEKGKAHKMTCVSDIGVRLACGEFNFSHIYLDDPNDSGSDLDQNISQ